MFFKYASNLLQDVSDQCMLKSFACKNSEDAELYRKLANKVDWLLTRIRVEETLTPGNKRHG